MKSFFSFFLAFIASLFASAQTYHFIWRNNLSSINSEDIFNRRAISNNEYKNDTFSVYSDFFGNDCNKENAFYYSIAYKKENYWVCEDYNIKAKKIARYAMFSNQQLSVKNGSFFTFHTNGKTETSGFYRNGYKNGQWVIYNQSGDVIDSSFYIKGMRTKKCYLFEDEDDSYTVMDLDSLGRGSGTFSKYYRNGTLFQYGIFRDGMLKDSTWTCFYPDGRISFIEMFKYGTLTQKSCYTPAGIISEDCVVSKEPVFPGGDEKRAKYMVNHTMFPSRIDLLNIYYATVIIAFDIEKDGAISNIKFIKRVHDQLDRELLRAVKTMPHWIPATRYNQPIKTHMILPFDFRDYD